MTLDVSHVFMKLIMHSLLNIIFLWSPNNTPIYLKLIRQSQIDINPNLAFHLFSYIRGGIFSLNVVILTNKQHLLCNPPCIRTVFIIQTSWTLISTHIHKKRWNRDFSFKILVIIQPILIRCWRNSIHNGQKVQC